MPFLPPNQQRQSTEGNLVALSVFSKLLQVQCFFSIEDFFCAYLIIMNTVVEYILTFVVYW